jgi:methylmalonyl-CoA carboxyltransferase large subunit
MSANSPDRDRLLQAIEGLREDVARLAKRMESLEQSRGASSRAQSATGVCEANGTETDESLILIISAAVAAYLGVEPRIRQIRLVGGAAWAQQGRVSIQASHALAVRHG